MDIQKVSLKDYSSLRVGGMGDLVIVKTEDELKDAVAYAKENNLHLHVIGGGTNSYFAEKLDGYLFLKPELKGIQLYEDGKFVVMASENWDEVVKDAVDHKMWGIENLSHIPGDAGAAPIQNIGAYGVELKDTLLSVRAFDTQQMQFVDLENKACAFGYRDSLFKRERDRYIIISITLQLSVTPRPILTYKPLDMFVGKEDVTLDEIRQLVIQTRDIKLPDWRKFPNTGSFFKNPMVDSNKADELREKFPGIVLFEVEGGYKVSAAWLIEHVAQMKGVRVGDVGTWPNQPLVIVNYGEATAVEIQSFAQQIQTKIEEGTGLHLEREVNYIGELQ